MWLQTGKIEKIQKIAFPMFTTDMLRHNFE